MERSETKKEPVVVCSTKAKINSLVSQAASHLLTSKTEVIILGKSQSISKAITVAEIVKRAFVQSEVPQKVTQSEEERIE